jgi:hypothetical protein
MTIATTEFLVLSTLRGANELQHLRVRRFQGEYQA